MGITYQNDLGTITMSDEVIASIVGISTTDCYGVVGMASKTIKDGIAELLKKENYSRGIVVRSNNEKVDIDIHVVVAFGVKISEVCHSIQTKVKFVLEETLGISINTINILVQGVKMLEE